MLLYGLGTVLLLFLTYYWYERKRKYETYWKYIYAIPGEPYNPILGNTQGYGKTAAELFYLLWDGAKIHTSIFRTWAFNVAFVFLMDPKDIEIVLSSMKHHSKGKFYEFLHKWLGTGLLTSSGAKWQYRRKILTPSFHFSILQTFVEIFNTETDNLVKSLKNCCSEGNINVLEPITEFTLNSIGETSLGININMQATRNEYKNAIYTFGDHFAYRALRPWLVNSFMYNLSSVSKKVDKAVKILHDFSANIIRERKLLFKGTANSYKEKKRMALLDLLLQAKKDGNIIIDDEGIREEVDTFMFEGHDTTALALCYLLLVLANEPKWQEEISKEIHEILGDNNKHPTFQQLNEMKLMERCIKESLRLYPSVPLITRVADENFKTTTGYIIPKGTNVNVPIFYMHRSEEIWENPEKFDPDRFLPENSAKRHPFAFVPFSAGPRNCIGQRFAMLEIKAALCGILRQFSLEPGTKVEEVVFKFDLTLRSHNQVKVKFVPKQRSSTK